MHELNKIRDHTVSVLDSISRPAAPYYERYVKAAVFSALDGLRQHPHVQIGTDRYGNIIARYRHPGARFDASLATAAHMDHPGFHIVSVSGDDITASIQGGLPRDDRLIGSSMHIFRGDREIRGTIRGFADASHDTITVTPESDPGPVLGNDYLQERDHAWGVPAVERFRVDGDLIHGRAMDDLAGCAQQIVALQRLVAEAVPVEFTALFNR
ncbi:hypothetical protein JXA80_10520, partial [bacterium]|nr:hypothetical protein [candidate division CSSED10-310 bacterium]